jgi:hypothetical protein
MIDSSNWPEYNSRYLTNAVARLRMLLERRAGQGQDMALPRSPEPPPQEKSKSGWRLFGRKKQAAQEEPNAAGGPRRPAIANSPAGVVATDSTTTSPPALVVLSQRLGLSRFEQEILLLCAAMELDPSIGALCARALGDLGRPHPTFALALSLFSDPAWDAVSPERPLRYWRLIEISQPGALPLTTSPLRADERIVNYLKGLNYLDDRLAPFLSPLEVLEHPIDLPASQRSGVDSILHHFKQTPGHEGLPIIQLLGPDGSSKQLIAGYVAKELGLHAYRLPVTLLPVQAAEIETLARLWQRESLLLPLALYLDADGVDGDVDHGKQTLIRFLGRLGGVVFLGTRGVWPSLGKPSLPVDVAKPTSAEQQAAWTAALGPVAGQTPGLLAGQFNLDVASIEHIAHDALTDAAANDGEMHDRLWNACLAGTRPQIENLAQRIDPKASWQDIVLPVAETNLLRQIADQVAQRSTVYETWGFSGKMSRGLGISVLFAGESGCGKTMAAEVLASHLRINLYRIDLSAIVSKYIGESAKNLCRLFDAAEDGGAILFFDECECIFGKRSEVKDSHDRYANTEIDYLLQRMESYRGLAILATNMKSSLDPAFMRRLRFVLNFPYPGTAERRAIWQKVFPTETPTEELDFDRLARLNLNGGNIHIIALNAAFLAAKEGTAVTMPLILEAARTEFRKLDRSINEADFRWSKVKGAVA